MVEDRRIDLGTVELEITEAGRGGHPLMLVHGWTGSRLDFADWMEPLAAHHFHVVAPDNRGHGHSSKPTAESDYSFDTFADDVLALADALGWDRFVLLGHSMGGMVAQVVALRAPRRLAGLVLMDTHHGPLDVAPEIVAAGIDMARTNGTEAIADMMAMATEPGPLDTEAYRRVCAERPGHFERGIETTRMSSSAMFAAMLENMAGATSRLPALASLEVPTLVMVGDQDEPFIDASQKLAATIPGARYELIADAGHSPQFEAPESWLSVMTSFLDSVHSPVGHQAT
jgi:pimeloyl-ACP methyl ester carboxylesterase